MFKPPDAYFFAAITASLVIAWGLEAALLKCSKQPKET